MSRRSTASDSGKISSDALGATITPPITVPDPVRANSFTKPSLTPIILARALEASGRVYTSPSTTRSSICFSVHPTVAISGLVKMFDAILRSSSGIAVSPIAWNTAVRPCIDATDASGSSVVQSPAA